LDVLAPLDLLLHDSQSLPANVGILPDLIDRGVRDSALAGGFVRPQLEVANAIAEVGH
jgi:hypothetical protein